MFPEMLPFIKEAIYVKIFTNYLVTENYIVYAPREILSIHFPVDKVKNLITQME